MALDKDNLIISIEAILDTIDQMNRADNANAEQIKREFSQRLASAIDTYVKSGSITIAINDINVTTTGNATNQAGNNINQITKNIE